jgi:hypothetical protein
MSIFLNGLTLLILQTIFVSIIALATVLGSVPMPVCFVLIAIVTAVLCLAGANYHSDVT